MLSQVRLILRKDLRRIRWVLIVFAALMVVGAAVTAWGTWRRPEARLLWDALLPVIPWLLGAIATAIVVHEDALVGTRAQWMTRPLRPSAILTAKALLLFGSFAFLPALVDAVLLGYFGLEPSQWLSATAHGAVSYGAWLLGAAAIASVTNGTAAFIVACLAALVAMTMSAITVTNMTAEVQGGELGGEIYSFVLLVVCVYVIARQYRRSGTLGSRIVLALGFLVTPFAMLIRLPDASPVAVEFEGSSLEASLTALPPAPYQSKSYVSLRLATKKAEPGRAYELRGLRGELVVEDGRRLSFEEPYDDATVLQGQIANLDAALTAALPEYAWSGPQRRNERFSSLLLRSDSGSADVPAGAHSLTARGQIQSHRFELIGTLPLDDRGRMRSHAIAVQISDVEMAADRIQVKAAFSTAVSAGASDVSLVTQVEYVLVNPARSRAARTSPSVGFDDLFRGLHIQRVGGLAIAETLDLRYEKTPDGAFDHLDNLELQVWKLVPAGKYTAVFDEPEFTVPPRPEPEPDN